MCISLLFSICFRVERALSSAMAQRDLRAHVYGSTRFTCACSSAMAQRDLRAHVAFSGCLGGVNLVFSRLFTVELSQLHSIFEGQKNRVEPALLDLQKNVQIFLFRHLFFTVFRRPA